jgi:hypothetical protein
MVCGKLQITAFFFERYTSLFVEEYLKKKIQINYKHTLALRSDVYKGF